MTKEKRGSEPELKLWDSPVTTKKYTKNRKTGQLDLLWGEERPLFDDWDNRMEQKTARARDCQSYSDLPVRPGTFPRCVLQLSGAVVFFGNRSRQDVQLSVRVNHNICTIGMFCIVPVKCSL